MGDTCRPEGTKSGGYCAVGGNDRFTSAEDCLNRCEEWDECVCGVAWTNVEDLYFCHLFTGSNSLPETETCQNFLSPNAFAGLYQPYGTLECGSEYHFGEDGSRFFAPNYWPDKPASMKSIWEKYFLEMEKLSKTLMRIFALGLSLDENWFDDKIDKHITNFSVIHYPGQNKLQPLPNQLRAGAHSDYGSLTIVGTNTDIGGLEIKNKGGEWNSVPFIQDAFVVNLGDLMAEWTNDRWIISLSKKSGELSKKEKEIIKKKQLLESIKNEKVYLKVLEAFPDAELIDIEVNTKQNDND